jgi:hypothetical protein
VHVISYFKLRIDNYSRIKPENMASYDDKPLTKSILSNLFLRNSCEGDGNVPGLNLLRDKT